MYLGEESMLGIISFGVLKLYFPTFLIKLEGASAENKHAASDILHFPDSKLKKKIFTF